MNLKKISLFVLGFHISIAQAQVNLLNENSEKSILREKIELEQVNLTLPWQIRSNLEKFSAELEKNNNSDVKPLLVCSKASADLKLDLNNCELKFIEKPSEQTQFLLKNYDQNLLKKIVHSSKYIQGMQLASLGVLSALPKDITNWGKVNLQIAGQNLKRAWTQPPVWDKDSFFINYISHPHSGSIYYNFMRSQNATPWESFLFAVAQSTLWEYVVEAPFERPSINDLIATPVLGALLGEATNRMTISMHHNGFNFLEKVAVIVLNPAYVVNNGFRTQNKVISSDPYTLKLNELKEKDKNKNKWRPQFNIQVGY